MFGLISFDDVWYVLNDEDDPNDSSFFLMNEHDLLSFIKNVLDFFNPTKTVKSFLVVPWHLLCIPWSLLLWVYWG